MYIDGYGDLSESGLCVFREWCPVSFLVVGECPSVLLLSVGNTKYEIVYFKNMI